MATLDVTSADAVLKKYYSNQRVQQLTYKDAPLFAMINKTNDFYGSVYPLPMRVTNPQGRSATFANAQGNKKPSNYKAFNLTRAKDYSLASIETEAILASEVNPGAFLKLATGEIDGALDSLRRSIQWSLYGDGTGKIGTVASGSFPAADTFKLASVEDIVHFEVGQTLVAYDTTNTTPQTWDAGGSTDAEVIGVDRDLGYVQTNRTLGGSFGPADIVFVEGDRNSKISGLAAWVPSTAPGVTPFFGVDRTVDKTRLGGLRIASTGKPLDEALIDAARRIGREGGNPDKVFMGFAKYAALEKTLQARVEYEDIEVAGIAFRGIKISGPKGPITVLPDQDCPEDRAYMLEMSTWGLYSLKEPVMLIDLDGTKMLREASADAFEVRASSYSQVGCTRPGSNGVMTF